MSDTETKGSDDGEAEREAFRRALAPGATLRDLNLDAFADGIIAHRDGVPWHHNPHGADAMTRRRLSWHMGWNERALQVRP